MSTVQDDVATRLIVSADYDPQDIGVDGVKMKIVELGRRLEGLDVYIKVNSVLRAVGYELILELRELGFKVFADLKLDETPDTLENDAKFLALYKPDIVTVKASAGVDGMRRLKEILFPTTEVMAVTLLTSTDHIGCQEIYYSRPNQVILRLANLALRAGISSLVLPVPAIELLRQTSDFDDCLMNTPAIRTLSQVENFHNHTKVFTPTEAIKAFADRIIIGRSITESANPREVVVGILTEIEQARAALQF